MRSRYSAYVRGLAGYLRHTWHPDTRPAELSLDDAQASAPIGLTVHDHTVTGATVLKCASPRATASAAAAR